MLANFNSMQARRKMMVVTTSYKIRVIRDLETRPSGSQLPSSNFNILNISDSCWWLTADIETRNIVVVGEIYDHNLYTSRDLVEIRPRLRVWHYRQVFVLSLKCAFLPSLEIKSKRSTRPTALLRTMSWCWNSKSSVNPT